MANTDYYYNMAKKQLYLVDIENDSSDYIWEFLVDSVRLKDTTNDQDYEKELDKLWAAVTRLVNEIKER